jgi:hypothetical protein
MFFKVLKLTQVDFVQLLVVLDQDEKPMLTIYNEHEGKTLLRMCEPSIENLDRAVKILNGLDRGDF